MASVVFCHELATVLAYELSHGNTLMQGPMLSDWPGEGSVYAQLRADFRMPAKDRPKGLEAGICNDPHYGWYEELYCPTHKHLLTAGLPRPRRAG